GHHVGAAGGELDLGGEDLGRDPGPVGLDGSCDLPRRVGGDRDPVGDGEAGFFSQVVEGPHHLSGGALGLQLVVELEVEGDGPAGLFGQGEFFVAGRADFDVVGAQGFAGDLDLAVGVERGLDRGAVGGGQRGLDLVDL